MTLRLNGSTSGYTEIDAPAVAGSNTIVLPSGNGSANQLLKNGSTAGSLEFSSSVYIDSSQRLLVGTSTSRGNGSLLQVVDDASNNPAQFFCSPNNSEGPNVFWLKARGGSTGSPSIVSSGDTLGRMRFSGYDGSTYTEAASIATQVDGTPGTNDMPGRLVFSTTADGASSPTERMRIASGGRVSAPSWYDETTASAANVNVASTGILQRSTSSIKYKTNVETIEDSYSDALLNCRPVWYRSTCANDNPNYGWWGFIAEEVAEIDPRLCFFEQKEDGNLEPEGVAYDRFVPHLLNLIKRQNERIEQLETRIAALEVTP